MNGIVKFVQSGDIEDTAEGSCDLVSSKAGRFQPGQSGNPRGRPRRPTPPNNAIDLALAEMVTIKDGHGTRKVPATVVIGKRVVQKAMAGDMKAVRELELLRPGFLLAALQQGNKTDPYDGFMKHLLDHMSLEACREFRDATASWQQKLRELGYGDPDSLSGRRRKRR